MSKYYKNDSYHKGAIAELRDHFTLGSGSRRQRELELERRQKNADTFDKLAVLGCIVAVIGFVGKSHYEDGE
jgi:hypothetical protein